MKYSGSSILLIVNGTEIACQKDLTLNIDRKLFDTSDKTVGWETHGNGRKSANVPFTALQSTEGLSGKELFDIISGTSSALLAITGFSAPYVAEVDLQNSVFTAPDSEAVTISGTFAVNGRLFKLASLVTDPDGSATDYDTLTPSGISIASAINAAGNAYCNSNAFGVTLGDVIKLFVFVTLNSGQLPTVGIWDNTSAHISNTQALVAGFNLVTLIVTSTDASASLRFSNSGAASWSTSNIYCFKS